MTPTHLSRLFNTVGRCDQVILVPLHRGQLIIRQYSQTSSDEDALLSFFSYLHCPEASQATYRQLMCQELLIVVSTIGRVRVA